MGLFVGRNGVQAQQDGGKGKKGGEKPVAAYFGMEDGSVQVRKAEGEVEEEGEEV